MGYILPVDRYQYIQYQERIRPDRLSISPVKPSDRVVLESQHQEITSEYNRYVSSSEKNIPIKSSNKVIHSVYAELTGKGRTIDEIV